MDTEFQFGSVKRALEMDGVAAQQYMNAFNTFELYTKMVFKRKYLCYMYFSTVKKKIREIFLPMWRLLFGKLR